MKQEKRELLAKKKGQKGRDLSIIEQLGKNRMNQSVGDLGSLRFGSESKLIS